MFLKERSDRVLELPEASSEDVIDLEELRDLYPDMFSNEDETHIVLYHLQKKGKIVVDASTPDTMIKFIPSSNSVNTPIAKRTSQQQQNTPVWNSSPLTLSKEKPSAEITEIDRSLATLRRTEMLLENEIDDLENQMQALEQTARTRLKEGARGAVSIVFKIPKFYLNHLTGISFTHVYRPRPLSIVGNSYRRLSTREIKR